MSQVVFIIPAYQPSDQLLGLVRQLRSVTPNPIVIVNDGSSSDRNAVFEGAKALSNVTILQHATNLGKGAALKTAFNHSLVQYPEAKGAITLDADGQHRVEDAIRVGQKLCSEPLNLILGCRKFDREHDVPFRSRFGNQLTRKVFKALTGVAVSDTQTGLRGIPSGFMRTMLRVVSSGYDFETDMLIAAVRQGILIREVLIPTIYLDGNSSSHFNPLLDSIRIYFVFIRFAFASIATAILDFSVFALAHLSTQNILAASISGRVVAGSFNFMVSKRMVFLSRGRFFPEFLRYTALVGFFLFLSNSAISALVRRLGMNVYVAKVLVESSLFFVSFTAQRLVVFPVSTEEGTTDWDAYYQKPFKTSSVTRKITIRRILNCFRLYGSHLETPSVLELGGGNSCIYGAIEQSLQPKKYIVVDKNRTGLKKFFETYPDARSVELVEGDVLNLKQPLQKADICFSIGLIEHFSKNGTADAIRAHFSCVNSDGLVLITFPTPTWLYRITRGIAETLNLWQFPDERPCTLDEITTQVKHFGDVVHCSIIWPIFLTQGLIVARPR